MVNLYFGIDPGKQGWVVALDECGDLAGEWPIPIIGKGAKGDYDLRRCADIIRDQATAIAHVGIEKPIIKAPAARSSVAKQWDGYGIWRGIAAGLELPYTLVPAKDWQAALLRGKPKGRDEVKTSAMLRAVELWPELNFKNTRPDGPEQGKADAALIAEYVRQTYGERKKKK